jgi:hypothetical protein
MYTRFVPSTLLVGALAACAPTSENEDEITTDAEESSSESSGAPVVACPEPTMGPTLHTGDVTGHEVWRADEGPHIVMTHVDITQGSTLEIEPCTVVQLAEDTGINVAYPGTPTTGTLLAEGNEDQPITFEGLHGARWGHLFVNGGGIARLAYVTITGGGGWDLSGASLIVHGDSTLPTKHDVLVDHVTVENSLGAGVVLSRKAGFAEGSDMLVVTGSGNEDHPFPIETDEHAVGSLPDGEYTGNLVDEILLDPIDRLEEDATIRELGLPYRIGNSGTDRLTVGGGEHDGSPATVLTIEPGVTLKFHRDTAFEIDHYSGEFPSSGALVAVGTADAPITFTSAEPTPAPGDWVGLWFGGIVDSASQLAHTRIEYTGGDCGCILLTCNDLDGFEGAVILSMPPPAMFVSDSVIAHGAGHGFVLGYDGDNVEFAENNTFEDVAGCPATLPRQQSCPDPRPACGE